MLRAYVLASLKRVVKDAKRRGNVAFNAAADVAIKRSARESRLKVGIDIPSREDIRRVLAAASNERERAFFMVAAFSGLRASELRGLRWADADLKNGRLHVRQRADRYGAIGNPKSRAGLMIPAPTRTTSGSIRRRLRCGGGEGRGFEFDVSHGHSCCLMLGMGAAPHSRKLRRIETGAAKSRAHVWIMPER